MPIYDFTSGLNLLNQGINSLGEAIGNRTDAQNYAGIGQSLNQGDYAGAAARAWAAGKSDLALKLQSMGIGMEQYRAAMGAGDGTQPAAQPPTAQAPAWRPTDTAQPAQPAQPQPVKLPAQPTGTGADKGRWAPPGGTQQDVVNYITQAALTRGIDPQIALQVARTEWGRTYTGDQGQSFGPYQLFTGGGLGNVFMQQTRLNPADPTTWKQQIDFALDTAAAKKSWGDWHGARNAGIPLDAGLANAHPAGVTVAGGAGLGPAQTQLPTAAPGSRFAPTATGIAPPVAQSADATAPIQPAGGRFGTAPAGAAPPIVQAVAQTSPTLPTPPTAGGAGAGLVSPALAQEAPQPPASSLPMMPPPGGPVGPQMSLPMLIQGLQSGQMSYPDLRARWQQFGLPNPQDPQSARIWYLLQMAGTPAGRGPGTSAAADAAARQLPGYSGIPLAYGQPPAPGPTPPTPVPQPPPPAQPPVPAAQPVRPPADIAGFPTGVDDSALAASLPSGLVRQGQPGWPTPPPPGTPGTEPFERPQPPPVVPAPAAAQPKPPDVAKDVPAVHTPAPVPQHLQPKSAANAPIMGPYGPPDRGGAWSRDFGPGAGQMWGPSGGVMAAGPGGITPSYRGGPPPQGVTPEAIAAARNAYQIPMPGRGAVPAALPPAGVGGGGGGIGGAIAGLGSRLAGAGGGLLDLLSMTPAGGVPGLQRPSQYLMGGQNAPVPAPPGMPPPGMVPGMGFPPGVGAGAAPAAAPAAGAGAGAQPAAGGIEAEIAQHQANHDALMRRAMAFSFINPDMAKMLATNAQSELELANDLRKKQAETLIKTGGGPQPTGELGAQAQADAAKEDYKLISTNADKIRQPGGPLGLLKSVAGMREALAGTTQVGGGILQDTLDKIGATLAVFDKGAAVSSMNAQEFDALKSQELAQLATTLYAQGGGRLNRSEFQALKEGNYSRAFRPEAIKAMLDAAEERGNMAIDAYNRQIDNYPKIHKGFYSAEQLAPLRISDDERKAAGKAATSGGALKTPNADTLKAARDQIAAGKSKADVADFMRAQGFDPSGL